MKQNFRPLCWDRAELQRGWDAAAGWGCWSSKQRRNAALSPEIWLFCSPGDLLCKTTAWSSELHYYPPAACSGAGLLPADCLEGTKIAAQIWEQGSISTSSGEVSPGKELIPHVPDGICSVPLHGIDTNSENLKQWNCVSWKP